MIMKELHITVLKGSQLAVHFQQATVYFCERKITCGLEKIGEITYGLCMDDICRLLENNPKNEI